MDHFWRKPVKCGNHVFIGQTYGYHKPWGETVKYGCYLIDSHGRHWNKDMLRTQRAFVWEWNK